MITQSAMSTLKDEPKLYQFSKYKATICTCQVCGYQGDVTEFESVRYSDDYPDALICLECYLDSGTK